MAFHRHFLYAFVISIALSSSPAHAQIDSADAPQAAEEFPETEDAPAADDAEVLAAEELPAEAIPLTSLTPGSLVTRYADANFNEKVDISRALAASGHPEAVNILNALVTGLLNLDEERGVMVYGPVEGGLFVEALTGTPIAEINEDALDRVTVNNRVRREVRGLAARLSLMSPDVRDRRTAARAAFAAADPETLPYIEEALGAETDETTIRRLEEAKAVILLNDEDTSMEEKLAAIATIGARGDQAALNALLGVRTDDEELNSAIDEIVVGIESSLAYWSALQNIIYGLSLGSVLLLAASGLAVTFGVMGVINMAHGEMIMLGAYATFVVQQVFLSFAPEWMAYSLVVALPVAFLVSGAAGVAVERGIIRFLYGRPLETLLATWGLSLILQQTVRSIFGPTNQAVIAPPWMSGSFEVGLLTITYSRMWIFLFSLFALLLLLAFLKYSKFGLQMRAVTQNRRMASSMGIRTDWVDALTFGLGSGIAGIAGVAISQIDNVGPNLGQSYIIDSFMVVVFGGVGNLWGTFVGAMSLGVVNKFLEPYAGAVLGKILVLAFIIFFIQRRPRGLFALRGRAVEA